MEVKMFLLILLISDVAFAYPEQIHTESGPVKGYKTYPNGKVVTAFLGIPYAEPPVGKLRFKKPDPVKPWSQPLIADTFPPSCIQYYPFDYPWVDQMPEKSEDCLYLNIWVPETASPNSPKTVMFWIFSGGLSSGSNRLPVYNGRVLAAEGDVIVVTINYRLGIFGFLSTASKEAPGNMGLYDVLVALKWVKINIGAFGGNPESVTVFGQSAGSLICGFLIVSPLSRGLFQRAIMESGAPNPSSMDVFKKNLQLGQKVAEALKCASKSNTIENNPDEVVTCIKSKNTTEILTAYTSITKTTILGFRIVYGDEILPLHPYDALRYNDFHRVDIIIGFTRDEGSFGITAKFPEIFGAYGEKNPRISKSLGRDLINETVQDMGNGEEIATYYLYGLREYDYDIVRSQTYHVFGDIAIICYSLYFATAFSNKGNNVYSYYYNHQSANTVFAPWMGVTHFIEVPIVFGRPLDQPTDYTEEEKCLSKKIIADWTNFAKYGTPPWKKFSYPYYTEYIQTNGNPNNYFHNHISNCEFLRKYLFS